MPIRIRPEMPGDTEGVRAVNLAAFPTALEADIVDRLRGDADWLVSLVAEEEKNPPVLTGGFRGPGIVGHVLLTRMRIDGAREGGVRVCGLAPVAVVPSHQKCGIGSALIRRAIEEARAKGVGAMFVLGDPAYYGRFGFERADAHGIRCAWAGMEDAFRVVELGPGALMEATPHGKVRLARYHDAFDVIE